MDTFLASLNMNEVPLVVIGSLFWLKYKSGRLCWPFYSKGKMIKKSKINW